MRQVITVVVLLAAASAAHGQAMSPAEIAKHDAKIAKMFRCSYLPSALIGLSSSELEAKCGRASKTNVTTTAAGRSEQLIYTSAPHHVVMYVYTENDVVTAVQGR